jgi:hypothetical protein
MHKVLTLAELAQWSAVFVRGVGRVAGNRKEK